MKTIFSICLFLLLVCLPLCSQEQNKVEHTYTYQHYGIREGLSQSQVFYSLQDSYGYLWFSTYYGVSRFDGKEFLNYSHEELNLPGRVRYMNQYEDAIFFVSGSTITFLYPDRSVESFPISDKINIQTIVSFIKTKKNLYFFHHIDRKSAETDTDTYFVCFDLQKKEFHETKSEGLSACLVGERIVTVTQKLAGNELLTVYGEINDSLLVLSEKQMQTNDILFLFPLSSDEFFILDGISASKEPKNLYMGRLVNDSLNFEYLLKTPPLSWISCASKIKDDYYFFAAYSANTYLIRNGAYKDFPIETSIINHSLIDNDGNLWLSSEDGVYNCHRLLFESYSLGLKKNDNIWNIHKDSYHNLWFTSYGLGIWKANQAGFLRRMTIGNENFDRGYMSSCEDTEGRIYLPHESGVGVFDTKGKKPEGIKDIRTGVSLAVYYDSLTHTVFAGGDNAMRQTTLNQIDEQLNVSTYLFNEGHIISICRDGKGKLRVGTFQGEYYFNEETKEFTEIPGEKPYRSVICMDPDLRGNVWKGGNEGVFVENEAGVNIPVSDGPANFLRCYRDKYVIWGRNNNLYILDLAAFYQDQSIRFRQFDYRQGFDILECGQNGILIDHEAYVWVVGGDCVLKFLPDELMASPEPHLYTPYIAAVYNRNKNTDWELIGKTEEVELENEDNFLQFTILQASISAPDKLRFRYRLIGYNDLWEETPERSIVFQNLSYGKYRLEIQSSLDGVHWSESAFSPSFKIKNPFFLTLPGILLLLLLTTIILASIIYWVRRISIRKQEEKRHIDQLRYRTVQSKFIPHFTGNVLNSINYLISKDPEVARKYIVDFSGFTGHSLRNADRLVRTLEEELEYAELYLKLEKLRFEEMLEYSITIDPNVNLDKPIPSMILQTFCENALKHGLRHKEETGIVAIHAYRKDDYLIVSVEDNGIGREKAKTMKAEGSGEGLKIVEQQLAIFNKKNKEKAFIKVIDLFDENKQAAGTRFELHIPGNYVF